MFTNASSIFLHCFFFLIFAFRKKFILSLLLLLFASWLCFRSVYVTVEQQSVYCLFNAPLSFCILLPAFLSLLTDTLCSCSKCPFWKGDFTLFNLILMEEWFDQTYFSSHSPVFYRKWDIIKFYFFWPKQCTNLVQQDCYLHKCFTFSNFVLNRFAQSFLIRTSHFSCSVKKHAKI